MRDLLGDGLTQAVAQLREEADLPYEVSLSLSLSHSLSRHVAPGARACVRSAWWRFEDLKSDCALWLPKNIVFEREGERGR